MHCKDARLRMTSTILLYLYMHKTCTIIREILFYMFSTKIYAKLQLFMPTWSHEHGETSSSEFKLDMELD